MTVNSGTPLPIVVLISGGGTNLQAIIDGQLNGSLPIEIRAVISNRPGVKGLERARKAGINAELIDHTLFPDRESFDAALMQAIDRHQPQLVVLAGFMRVLTDSFVNHYLGRLLNIHPSLLPKYPGLHTHQRVIEAGDPIHGVTVHFVTPQLDGGPAITQAQVPVLRGDSADSLAQRVLTQEHRIYPLAIQWYAEGRLQLKNDQTYLNGEPLGPSGYLIRHPSIDHD
jgi:phosphoribosylglycinamide formyltransferase-1